MNEPMRILHVVFRMNRGGMESRLMDIYRKLNRNKYQFDFYVESGRHGAYDNEIEQLGGKIYYPDKIGRFGFPNFFAFKRFLQSHKVYRLIYAYNQWAGWYLREAEKCGVPYRIAFSRTSLQTFSLKNCLKNLLKCNVNCYATHRFAVSKKAAIWLFGKKMVDCHRVTIWPNAINTEKYRFSLETRLKTRSELGLKDELTAIHVGNLRFEKNHPFLLEIFAELRNLCPNASLFLVGDGNIETLRCKIGELGVHDSVHYLGVRNDVPNLLQAGDLFIFPSLYEGFPGAVLEAECAGLPCFISDTITEEVILTDCVKQLSLNDSPANWAKEIKKCMGQSRKDKVELVKAAGYDIYDLTRQMESFFKFVIDEELCNEARI